MSKMVDQGSQMAGNWERRRPEEGGGWETLYDKDGFAYYYSHYTGEQTYSMPKEYAHAQGIMTVSRPITDIPTAAIFHGHSPTRRIMQLNNQGQYDQHYGVQGEHVEHASVWEKLYDEEGYEYYYNHETGDSTYDVPPELSGVEANSNHNEYEEEGSHEAATSIQKIVRGYQHRKIALQKKELFENMTKMHNDAIIDKSELQAAIKIQSLGRKYTCHKRYLIKKKSTVIIQSLIRAKLAKVNVKTLRAMSPVLARLSAAIAEKHSLYGSEIKNANDLFIKMDKDGDGQISKEDFSAAVNRLDIGMKEKQINTLIWAMNSHTYTEQPRIHYDDFLRGIQIGKAKYNKLQDLASMPQEAEQPMAQSSDGHDSQDSPYENEDNESNSGNESEAGISSQSDDDENGDEEKEEKDNNDLKSDKDVTESEISIGFESANNEESEAEEENDVDTQTETKTPQQRESHKSKRKRKRKEAGKPQKKLKRKTKLSKSVPTSKRVSARPPVPKQYHEEFETLGVNQVVDSTKRVGFLRVTKAKLLKRIEENSDDGDAFRKLGFLLHEQKKYLEAVEKLQKGISLGYKNGRVWRTMGHCFYELDQVDSARESYGRAMKHKSNEDAPLMFYRAARMEMRRGEYRNAYEILLKVESRFKKFNDRQSVWFALGASAYSINEPRKAIKHFKQALQEQDSETNFKMKGNFKRVTFYQMARAYEELEMFNNRTKCDKVAQVEMPVDSDGNENSDMDTEAHVSSEEEELASNNTLDPKGKVDKVKRGDFHVKIASYLVSIKFHGLAIAALERALEINKKKPEWLSLLAYALHEQGKIKKATKVGERAEKLAAKSGDSWRASSSPWSPPLKAQLPAWRLEAIPPPVDVVISSYSPRSRPSSARSSRPASAPRSGRIASRPSSATSLVGSVDTSSGNLTLSATDISRLVEEIAKKLSENQLLQKPSSDEINKALNDSSTTKVDKNASSKPLVVKHEMSTQMTPREVSSDNDQEQYASKEDAGSDLDTQTDKESLPDIDVDYSKTENTESVMLNTWSGRSQNRIKRVAALAARATQALAHALAFESNLEASEITSKEESNLIVNADAFEEDNAIHTEKTSPLVPISPATQQKMRNEIITGPVKLEQQPESQKKEINFRERRDIVIAKNVFDTCRPDENNTVDKQLYLNTLEEDFDLQEFIRKNSYCLVTPLLLRKVHLKVEKTATPFERNKRISWDEIVHFLENHTHTSSKGAFNDNGDSYDPRFASDSHPLRGQKERAAIAKKEAEEKEIEEQKLRLEQQKLYESKLNDWPDEYKDLDPAPDDLGFESVEASKLDHKLSWQGPVHTKAPMPKSPVIPEKWEDPKRDEEFQEKRSELLADLAVARTNYNVRDLEAKQQIARMEQELRIRNKKSKAHMAIAEREGSAAAVAALAANSEAVTREVERHINNIEESLAMRRARKGARRESHAKHIALGVVHNYREKSFTQGTSSGIDDRDEDSDRKHSPKRGKKIFVAGNDVELRMLFADYEHGTDVRKKIVEVQTVHPHVTEEEAFLALAETAGNVDLAIGKLSNLSFFRDVRAVSNLHKESEAGAVIQATSTALERTLDSGKERQDVVYKKFKLFRQKQENSDDSASPKRIPPSGPGKGGFVDENIFFQHKKGKPSTNGHTLKRPKETPSVRIAHTVAQSPYMVAPFPSAKKRPRTAGERRKIRERRRKGMADGMPGYIEGALRADRKWRKGGGMRQKLNRVVGRVPSLRKASGGGSNAAKLLQHNKVSKFGAFGGFNPTIDNPTHEYKAVVYAANELKPISQEPFVYKSEYRTLNSRASNEHRSIQDLSNLA